MIDEVETRERVGECQCQPTPVATPSSGSREVIRDLDRGMLNEDYKFNKKGYGTYGPI